MGRWAQYDEDEHRLPEGMTRVGYDADTQTYSYRDEEGKYWEGAPGARYGVLQRVGGGNASSSHMYADESDSEPSSPATSKGKDEGLPTTEPRSKTPRFAHFSQLNDDDEVTKSARENPWRMLAPFFLLVCLFLLLVFRLLNGSTASDAHAEKDVTCREHQAVYQIRPTDTCWAIAEQNGMNPDHLIKINPGIDCDHLRIGSKICVIHEE